MAHSMDADPLRVTAVGDGISKDDLPDGPFVVLTGGLDAVREAARFFGDSVKLVAASEGGAA